MDNSIMILAGEAIEVDLPHQLCGVFVFRSMSSTRSTLEDSRKRRVIFSRRKKGAKKLQL